MTADQLKQLFNQSAWSEEEKQQLLRYLEQGDPAVLEQVLLDSFLAGDHSGPIAHKDSVAILNALRQKIGAAPAVIAPPRVLPLKRIALVAACLAGAILLTVAYWWRPAPAAKDLAGTSSQSPATRPIVPGSDGAILTLADGSQIVLDSAENGRLASDGHLRIEKQGGRIAYSGRDGTDGTAFNQLSTPRGRQYQLELADGSKIWLNAQSSIRYPTVFNGKERRVSITGEAYFEVAKNPGMPFHVEVNGVDIAVLGTHFNINAYDDQAVVKTTLLEGSVRLTKGAGSLLLQPGQAGQIPASSENFALIKDANTEEAVAWKEGRFFFDHTDIRTIMAQLCRWYDVEVDYQGPVPRRSFTGDLSRNTPLSDFLKVLEESKIHFRIENRKIIVSP
ncbi:MAG: FecR domain-containing protein [Chitinophagaceae bacterium]|nr:FecR domain-containing protein [Chitinophagaceae bacterium]